MKKCGCHPYIRHSHFFFHSARSRCHALSLQPDKSQQYDAIPTLPEHCRTILVTFIQPQENTMKNQQEQQKQKKPLPSAGPLKRNPKELDKILDQALKDSMSTSDPIATVMPEVKKDSEKTKS
jgi:hypothetical protein